MTTKGKSVKLPGFIFIFLFYFFSQRGELTMATELIDLLCMSLVAGDVEHVESRVGFSWLQVQGELTVSVGIKVIRNKLVHWPMKSCNI